jgi:serine/threonine-protein kinase
MATCPTCRTQYPDDVSTCPEHGVALVPDSMLGGDADLAAGDMVGDYRIEAKIGEGGFGAVYRAVHPLIGKAAAVKVLNRQYSSNPQMVSRFISEARAVNQIRHRNIIDIFAFGQLADGRSFYTMELLDGMGMDVYLRKRGRLPVAEAVPILRQIARALDAAHAAGIAHRDLKPENVYLVIDDEGTVFPKLLDFGIAKLLTDSGTQHKTRTGTPMGTPHYMSPEQSRGRDVDHRTDVYSFGVMVHKTLTGQLPFDGDDVIEILVKQATATPPRMSEVCPGLAPELDGPVLHMLEKAPNMRPTSLAIAVDELAAAASLVTPRSLPSGRVVGSVTPDLTPDQIGELGGARTLAGPGVQTLPTPGAAPPPSRSRAVIALAVVALLGLVGAAAAMLRPSSAATNEASPPRASASAVNDRVPTPSAVAVSASAAPVVAPSEEVDVSVQSAVKGEVFLDGQRLGATPGPFRLKRGDAKLKLLVKAEGYKPAEVEVTPSANVVAQVTLVRLAGPAPRRQPGEIENPFR